MRNNAPLYRLPLRLRLSLWYILVMAVSMLLTSIFLYIELGRSLVASVDLALEAAITQAANGVENDDGRIHFTSQDSITVVIGGNGQRNFAVRLISAQGEVVDAVGAFLDGPDWPSLDSGLVTTGGNGGRWRVMTDSIHLADRRIVGWLQAAESLAFVDETLGRMRTLLLLALPLVLLLAGGGGLFLVNEALRPIRKISATARSITASDLGRRMEYRGAADEVAELAETFDQMLDRIEAGFAQQRRFTADASHELRTPLSALKGQIEISLSKPRSAADYRATLESLSHQVERLIRLSNDLLFLTRLDADPSFWNPRSLSLSDLLSATVEQFGPLVQAKAQRLHESIEPDIRVMGDMDQLIRLIMNLLDNALKYAPEKGIISVELRRDGPNALLTVGNSGPGIPPADLPRIFDRFYRVVTDRSRESGGSGLGLAIASEIARRHGGRLTATSDPAEAPDGLEGERCTRLMLIIPAL